MDNRHLPYINAILAADIKGKAKFTLTFLLDTMDFDTRETYIGQKALAKKMGVSYDAAADGIDLLEELKLIELVGTRPINPSSLKETNVYRVLLEPLEEVTEKLTIGKKSMVGESTIGKSPTVGKSPNNLYSDVPAGGEIVPSALGGVDLSSPKEGVNSTHMHTRDAEQSTSSRKAKTTSKTKASAASSKASPSSTQPESTETPEPPGTLREGDPSQKSPAAPGVVLTEYECRSIANTFQFLTKVEDPNDLEILRSYRGPLSAARLELLLFYAFNISKFWSKKESWWSLDMENFLNVAVRKLDSEFRDNWRQHEGFVKKFALVGSVLNELSPPPIIEKATKLGLIDYVGSGPTMKWFVGLSSTDAVCTGTSRAEVVHDVLYYYHEKLEAAIATAEESYSKITVGAAFGVEEEPEDKPKVEDEKLCSIGDCRDCRKIGRICDWCQPRMRV